VQGYTVSKAVSPTTPLTVYLHPRGRHPCVSPSKICNYVTEKIIWQDRHRRSTG